MPDKDKEIYVRGRGAQKNPANRFFKTETVRDLEHLATEEEREEMLLHNPKTKFIEVFPKTLVNKVDSPDLRNMYSLNPYQGCEHGCIYCYARNSHEYWDYSAGAEFEQNIMVKKIAPKLLRQYLDNPKWKATPMLLSGNTDCYQPAERQFKITRQLLEVFYEYRHPIGIITKNTLIERDIDILSKLAGLDLVQVVFSLTTLDEDLKRIMEPRTASARNILRAIRSFSEAGIPVSVNAAPMIPAINDDGLFDIIRAASEAGARSVHYIVVRLNGQIGTIFEDWVTKNFPDRANKVLNRIKAMHDGKLNDSQFGRRMRGEGEWADLMRSQYDLAMRKFFPDRKSFEYNTSLYEQYRDKQYKLF
ncbi:MAG: PA0069 family radical SAM protein [Bacteroidetes bacterium]|nr:PA0069 family radical SAM protein [Bacteroidota bacterium]